MKNEIQTLKLRLNEKDEIIKKKDLQLDELRITDDELKKKKIELLQIIEALKEEKEVILKTISDINAKIEGQNKKIDDQYTKFQELLNDKIKMQEASLISDILFQLHKQFILKNKDDNVIKENFITYKKKVVSKTVYIANIDTKFFHRCLNN